MRQKYDAYPKIVMPILEAIGGVGQTFLDTIMEMEEEPGKEDAYYR